MYLPGSSDDLIFRDDIAVYGPKDHQRVISKLNTRLGTLYYDAQTIKFEPLPETMLDDGQASRNDGPPTPDIILFDNSTQTTPIIVEICHTAGLRKDIKKVIRLVDEEEYGILEGFVYDYKTENWLRYRKSDAGLLTETSYSEVLNLDLGPMLL